MVTNAENKAKLFWIFLKSVTVLCSESLKDLSNANANQDLLKPVSSNLWRKGFLRRQSILTLYIHGFSDC